MRNQLIILAVLLGGVPEVGLAQSGRFTVRPHVGVFAPALPLVAIADGHPHVQLGGAPTAGIELAYQIHSLVAFYGGVSSAFTRLHHSTVMELREVDSAHSSRATLLTPAVGVLLTPQLGTLALQPTLRLGLGTKLYYFDLGDVDNPVADLTGDFGLGLAAGAGPVRVLVEARWLASRFDARFLPIRSMGNENQTQNDWSFQLGFRLAP